MLLEEDAPAESHWPPRNNRLFSIWSGDDSAVKEEYYRDCEHVKACQVLGEDTDYSCKHLAHIKEQTNDFINCLAQRPTI